MGVQLFFFQLFFFFPRGKIYGCPTFLLFQRKNLWVSNFSPIFLQFFSMGVQFFLANFSCSPGIRHHLENRSLTRGKKKTCMCNGGMLVVLVFRSGRAESIIPEPKGCVSIEALVFSLQILRSYNQPNLTDAFLNENRISSFQSSVV